MAHDPYASLRFPEYRAFLASMATVFVATQVQSAVLGWQVYAITGDPLALGLVGLAEALPFLLLTLVGGWAADRFDRRALSLASLAAVGGSGAWLFALSLGAPRSALPFYGAQALAGLGRAFFRPASAALGTELVPREHYHNASSWRSSVFHVAMVLGPAAGGGLIAFGGPRVAYAVVCVLTLVGLGTLLLVSPRPRPAPAEAPGRIADELADGVRFVFDQPLLLGAMSLDLFAVLFGGAAALLPVFARDVLGVGEVGFGVLRAAPAVGSVVMSFALVRFGELRRAGRTLLWSVACFGLCWMAFAASRSYALSLALLALAGALDNVSVVLRSTLVQTFTPQEKMGRVSAVNSFFIGSSNELGAFESGLAAKLLGTVPSVLFGGAMTLVTVGAVAWRAPALRRLTRIAPP
ncbi:MFS transporter [Anaeromyxobacter paludicola]|uniref:MFS transporter n=1 Tax=Anaeromyxobacter paludicola TaxID=2918171 RepID=UPI0020C03E9C|nr:MFS transporter [Anaeromyxobacter paludicola]